MMSPAAHGGGAAGSGTRYYGRRKGRPLRPGRSALIERLLPTLRVSAPPGDGPFRAQDLFDKPVRTVWLEIGFGSGEHLVRQAASNPEVGFIGAEPFVNGVAKLLAAIERERLDNIRIVDDDVRPLLRQIAMRAPASIGRAFVLFPDPWPKSRHHKRRIINSETVADLALALEDGAELRVASDVADYVAWTLSHVLADPAFVWLARRPGDWRERPDDWPQTRYESKAIDDGRDPVFLRFRRRPR